MSFSFIYALIIMALSIMVFPNFLHESVIFPFFGPVLAKCFLILTYNLYVPSRLEIFLNEKSRGGASQDT